MKHAPFVLLLFVICHLPVALTAQKPYFQQEVNYKIVVSLDDKTHTLTGNIEIEYINHSPDTLAEIWMHWWGNAFKNRGRALYGTY